MSVLVLYAEDMEQTRRLFEGLGLEFTQEQHGAGPSHYACQTGDAV